MGDQKKFFNKEFTMLLLGVLGVALIAAAEEIARRAIKSYDPSIEEREVH